MLYLTVIIFLKSKKLDKSEKILKDLFPTQ